MLNVFRTVPTHNEDGTPRMNNLGDPVVKLVYNFPFQWTRKHFYKELGSYVWREGELGVEDQESFIVLTSFVAQIPRVQQVGWGGKPVIDKNGEVVYESGIKIVKKLLGSKDPVKYLGIYVLNSCMWSSLS